MADSFKLLTAFIELRTKGYAKVMQQLRSIQDAVGNATSAKTKIEVDASGALKKVREVEAEIDRMVSAASVKSNTVKFAQLEELQKARQAVRDLRTDLSQANIGGGIKRELSVGPLVNKFTNDLSKLALAYRKMVAGGDEAGAQSITKQISDRTRSFQEQSRAIADQARIRKQAIDKQTEQDAAQKSAAATEKKARQQAIAEQKAYDSQQRQLTKQALARARADKKEREDLVKGLIKADRESARKQADAERKAKRESAAQDRTARSAARQSADAANQFQSAREALRNFRTALAQGNVGQDVQRSLDIKPFVDRFVSEVERLKLAHARALKADNFEGADRAKAQLESITETFRQMAAVRAQAAAVTARANRQQAQADQQTKQQQRQQRQAAAQAGRLQRQQVTALQSDLTRNATASLRSLSAAAAQAPAAFRPLLNILSRETRLTEDLKAAQRGFRDAKIAGNTADMAAFALKTQEAAAELEVAAFRARAMVAAVNGLRAAGQNVSAFKNSVASSLGSFASRVNAAANAASSLVGAVGGTASALFNRIGATISIASSALGGFGRVAGIASTAMAALGTGIGAATAIMQGLTQIAGAALSILAALGQAFIGVAQAAGRVVASVVRAGAALAGFAYRSVKPAAGFILDLVFPLRSVWTLLGDIRRRLGPFIVSFLAFTGIRKLSEDIGAFEANIARAATEAESSSLSFRNAFRLFETSVRETAANTRFTASEASAALGSLVKSGFDAQQALNSLKPALSLSALSGTGVQEATDILGRTVAAFGVSTLAAENIIDGLVAAAKQAPIGLEETGTALARAAATARLFNLDFNTTVSLITSLGQVGIRGERAATALVRGLERLVDPADAVQQSLQRVLALQGKNIFDFLNDRGQLKEGRKSLLELVDTLNRAVRSGQLTNTLRTQIFGSRGREFAQLFVDRFDERTGTYISARQNLERVLVEVQRAQQNDLATLAVGRESNTFQALFSQIKGLVTEIGLVVTQQFGQDFRNALISVVGNMQKFIALLKNSELATRVFQTIRTVFMSVANALAPLIGYIVRLNTVISGVLGAGITFAATRLSGPFLQALRTVIFYIARFLGLPNLGLESWQSTIGTLVAIFQNFGKIVETVFRALKIRALQAVLFVRDAFESMVPRIAGAFASIRDVILQTLIKVAVAHFGILKDVIAAAFASLKVIALRITYATLDNISKFIGGALATIFTLGLSTFSSEGAKAGQSLVIGIVRGVGRGALGIGKAIVDILATALSGSLSGLGGLIGGNIGGALESVGSRIDSAMAAYNEEYDRMYRNIQKKPLSAAIFDESANFGNAFRDSVRRNLGSAFDPGVIANNVAQGLESAQQQTRQALANSVNQFNRENLTPFGTDQFVLSQQLLERMQQIGRETDLRIQKAKELDTNPLSQQQQQKANPFRTETGQQWIERLRRAEMTRFRPDLFQNTKSIQTQLDGVEVTRDMREMNSRHYDTVRQYQNASLSELRAMRSELRDVGTLQ